jgi:hypothetical protein
MSQLAANGGQPQKAPKYAPIYQGRFFNGLNTNRSRFVQRVRVTLRRNTTPTTPAMP